MGEDRARTDRSRQHEQTTRRSHAPAFQAKVALQAVRRDGTIAEIAQKHDVDPSQVAEWRRPLLELAADVFGGAAGPAEPPVDLKVLNASIGQLTLENGFFRKRAHPSGFAERKKMVDRTRELPVKRQAELLNISRCSVYYHPEPISAADLALMRRIDAPHLEQPFAGSRMLRDLLRREGFDVGRRHVATLMRRMGIEALNEAINRFGPPEIMNTDQGSQFTGADFIDALKHHGIAIGMDGCGQWRDNVFVERLCKRVKYEEVYPKAYESVSAARQHIGRYFAFYIGRRPHRAHDGQTPDAIYSGTLAPLPAAA